MNRTNFIVSLAKYRMVKSAVKHGVPHSIAVAETDAQIKEAGLTGFFAKVKVTMLPDNATVLMVEHYMSAMASQERAGVRNEESKQAYAAGQIERGRGRIVPGRANYPTDLANYIFYRHELEVPALLKRRASDMGLDRETIEEQIVATLVYLDSGRLVLAA